METIEKHSFYLQFDIVYKMLLVFRNTITIKSVRNLEKKYCDLYIVSIMK